MLGREDGDVGAEAGDRLHPLRGVEQPGVEGGGVRSLARCVRRLHVPVAWARPHAQLPLPLISVIMCIVTTIAACIIL